MRASSRSLGCAKTTLPLVGRSMMPAGVPAIDGSKSRAWPAWDVSAASSLDRLADRPPSGRAPSPTARVAPVEHERGASSPPRLLAGEGMGECGSFIASYVGSDPFEAVGDGADVGLRLVEPRLIIWVLGDAGDQPADLAHLLRGGAARRDSRRPEPDAARLARRAGLAGHRRLAGDDPDLLQRRRQLRARIVAIQQADHQQVVVGATR